MGICQVEEGEPVFSFSLIRINFPWFNDQRGSENQEKSILKRSGDTKIVFLIKNDVKCYTSIHAYQVRYHFLWHPFAV